MPTPLAEKIARLIAHNGPMSVADFFALCLGDAEHGYYRARQPFGRHGDFVTAPEISQLFGEMIGVFLVNAWVVQGRPQPVRLVELGPGRGTMMRDILRVARRLAPTMLGSATPGDDRGGVHLVETSPALAEVQRTTLADAGARLAWHTDLAGVPEGFTLLVANELFDAVPMRQFVHTAAGLRERVVTLGKDGALTFATGTAVLDPALAPQSAGPLPDGAVIEVAPARNALMQRLAERLVAGGGTALIIDYGYLAPAPGDTLQAIRGHAFDPPLAHPGEADLTGHVDFAALAAAAMAAGAHVHGAMTQGDLLVGLGLLGRAETLGRGKDAATQESLREAVERLAGRGPGNMGELFKALAVSGRPAALPPFAAEN